MYRRRGELKIHRRFSIRRRCAADAGWGVISNTALVPGSNCHLTLSAIREDTLSSDPPVLKDPNEGDIIDFYGLCDIEPLGEDQVHQQSLQHQHRWQRNYND